MPTSSPAELRPFSAFLQLLLIIAGGLILFTSVTVIILYSIYGAEYQIVFQGNTDESLAFLRIIQILSTIVTFIIPAIIFAKLRSENIFSYLHFNRVPAILILASVALMFSVVPVLEWMVMMNQKMHLPEFLKGVEEWMRNKEDELQRLTIQLLTMSSVSDLLINLLMIAILPAIGEELIFRGCFQKIFTSWAGNYHWGIWIAAILFSAIHFQFYGFIPRMLLGALFGYLLVWGKSIWLPIVAHFVNNATTVIAAYVYQLNGKPIDKLDELPPMEWPFYIFSVAATCLLLLFIYKQSAETEYPQTNGRGLD